MKNVCAWAILLLASAHTAASTRAVGAGGARGAAAVAQTPITRVVKLLQGLALKTELEGKREEDLYEKFVCWAKSIIDSKTASNAAAAARVETLKGYIADIDAGRIEFTTERKDLEYELKCLYEDKGSAEAQRTEENNQFVAAEAEMEQAIAALTKAITVLEAATENAKNGTLLVQRHQDVLGEGFSMHMQDSADLAHAVELGQKTLSAGDALFLRRLLTAEVPKHDWKKLNRKATFKMSYKARSFKIQAVLKKLNETFTVSLSDARTKEAEAQALFDKLLASKEAQISETQEALQKLIKETGVKQMTRQESQDEVDALELQISNDMKFIEQTKKALAEKKAEWKERYTLRAAEVAAMRQAASILYSDDARDLAKRSFESQGYMLLQESREQQASLQQRLGKAATVLREAAHGSSDLRLAALASRLAAGSTFAFPAVIEAIDTMLANLKEEEEGDLQKKEECEENRAQDTRSAAKMSREMDESTELIMRLKTEIEELAAEIAEKKKTIATTKAELDEATAVREAENAEYIKSKKDDTDMYETVQKAKTVLESFYEQNGLVFAQQPQAGEAPPPPPATWEGPYMGKGKQANSVIATLDIISEDIQKDITKADAAELKASTEYDTFKSESVASMEELSMAVDSLSGTKADKEEAATTEAAERRAKKGSLEAVLQSISDANPGCEYFTVNYPKRLRNRQLEIDGLRKAKTILQGGSFSEGPDPSRELKPGDALFLQHRR